MPRSTPPCLLGAALACLLTSSAQADVMLQGWYWDYQADATEWYDELAQRLPELRAMGITSIWLPPACKGGSGIHSSGYDPYDYYDLGSKDQKWTARTKWGSKRGLLALIALAHAQGMQVFFDAVPNHRSGGEQHGFSYRNLVGSEAPGRFGADPQHFHHGGTTEETLAVAGLPDLAQEDPYVRDELFRWIRWVDRQTGVDGYRIDAAKHMPAAFVEGLLWQVQEGLGQERYAFSEVFDGNPGHLEDYVSSVQRRSSVYDFTLFYRLLDMTRQAGAFDMRRLRERMYDDTKRVTFVNTHDTFGRGNGLQIADRFEQAYAFTLTTGGRPCVYWRDLFDDQGRARDALVNLLWIHDRLAHGDQLERWAGPDLYVYERRGNLLAGLNDGGGWRSEWVQTGFGPNARLVDYTGHGGDLWTNQDGWVQVAVPPASYVMYAPPGQGGPLAAPTPVRTAR